MKWRKTILSASLTVILASVLALPVAAQRYEKLAPYPAIRWEEGDRPHVQIQERWYGLLAVNGITLEDMVAFSKKTYADRWKKRINEDLVQVMSEMGHPPSDAVALSLQDLSSGAHLVKQEVSMTRENRQAIWEVHTLPTLQEPPPLPVSRRLSAREVHEDLDAFQAALEARFAYLKATPVDYRAALEAIRRRVVDSLSVDELGVQLDKIIALFIDGHAGVSGYERPEGYLPFLVEPSGDRFVAFTPDRSGFLDDAYPYVTRIDDLDLAQWLEVAAHFRPKGSPQYVRRQALRILRSVQFLRAEMGRDPGETVSVELAATDPRRTTTLTLAVTEQVPTYGLWPRSTDSKILDGNIGYLRLAAMNDEAVHAVRTWMLAFRDTDGLIVDVRGNGGGSRAALLELFPYFMRPDDPPHIANVAAYRFYEGFGRDHLGARYMAREEAERWSEAERAAIRRFKQEFRPEWLLPAGQFSAWHYLILSKTADDPRFYYDKPVVMLQDAKCFSATDIFLGAFKGWRNVTLLGQPSSGGSARSQTSPLPHSRLRVRLASMASFQPSGLLYDTHGVVPDVYVDPDPTYFLHGQEDPILQHALGYLRTR